MTGRLFAQLAHVALRDADKICDPYAWPPRSPLTDEERREVDRLRVLAARFEYRARTLGVVNAGVDAAFGGAA